MPKKARATLRGITARRLAAQRRLVAAISELEQPGLLFSGSDGSTGEVEAIASTGNGDNGAVPSENPAPGRRSPLTLSLSLLTL